MFSVQRKKEALGRGTVKLLPRNLLNSICEHVRSLSCIYYLQLQMWRGLGEWWWSEVVLKPRTELIFFQNPKAFFNYCTEK